MEMEYIISMLESKLRFEQKCLVEPEYFNDLKEFDKVACRISQEIAERRIPQIKKTLELIKNYINQSNK
jgi:hypothetical protein